MATYIGQQFGNYRLVQLIGSEGFADVYLGQHIHIDMQAAIKILHVQMGNEDIKRFRFEAGHLAHLIHPHIIRLLDFGIENTILFLILDYASHGTIQQRHPKGSVLPLPTVLSYVQQIGDALQYAHDQNLIHRDVKPANILIGQHNEILLGDFGIATMNHNTTSLSRQTIAGTTYYMAPEQISGKPCIASDQYALGVIVYEWLCGACPFNGTAMEIGMQHMLTPPLPLRQRNATISPHVEYVVLKALAKDPRERFESVHAFVNALLQANEETKREYPIQMVEAALAPTTFIDSPVSTLPISQPPRETASMNTSPPFSHTIEQAYEKLCKQVKPRSSVSGALVIRVADDQVGKAVYALQEGHWIRHSPNGAAYFACTALAKKCDIKGGSSIPAAIFNDLDSDTDYMIWIEEDKPVSVFVRRGEVVLLDLTTEEVK